MSELASFPALIATLVSSNDFGLFGNILDSAFNTEVFAAAKINGRNL